MLEIQYRKSVVTDEDSIRELVNICFGSRDCSGVCSNLDGRYTLAFVHGKLIAMTGLAFGSSTEYDGYEVEWSCVHPNYRGNNLLCSMLKEELKGITGTVYCSCLHLGWLDNINLYKAMNMLGFVLFRFDVKEYKYGVSEVCDGCIYNGVGCECSEDLYVLVL